jgi:N6-adenosine-specific RNA methylase IME4
MKKYQIIYADPPWNFRNRMYSSNKNDHHRAITRAYSVMKTEDICALPIKDISDNDCALFMWVADAFLPDAITIMKSWGFKYKTIAFIWDKREWTWSKTRFMGQWTMKNCEIVLLGTKGTMTKYLKCRNIQQLQSATRVRTINILKSLK